MTIDESKDDDLIVLRRSEIPVLLQRLATLAAAQLGTVLKRHPQPRTAQRMQMEAEVVHLRAVVASKDREIGTLRAYIGPERLRRAEREREEQRGMVNVLKRGKKR